MEECKLFSTKLLGIIAVYVMKILAFTDTHYDTAILRSLVKKAKNCDLMLCCGDISIFGNGLIESIEILKKAKKPLLVIHGNHDDPEVLKEICDDQKVIFMHKKIKEFDDIIFCAYGGGGFSFSDDKFDDWARAIGEKLDKIRKGKKLFFFTHAPPYGTKLDNLPLYGHRGSISGRNAIKLLKPDYFASGHFHEPFYEKDSIGKTLMINPGDQGTIIEI